MEQVMEPLIVIGELIKLASVGIIAGLFTSFVANRDHRYKKWWELRVDAYQQLIEALSDIAHYYECHYLAEITYRKLSYEAKGELSSFWNNAFPKVRKFADAGAFLFSEEVNVALEKFIHSANEEHQTRDEHLDHNLHAAKKCLIAVVNASKKDLMVKESWL